MYRFLLVSLAVIAFVGSSQAQDKKSFIFADIRPGAMVDPRPRLIEIKKALDKDPSSWVYIFPFGYFGPKLEALKKRINKELVLLKCDISRIKISEGIVPRGDQEEDIEFIIIPGENDQPESQSPLKL